MSKRMIALLLAVCMAAMLLPSAVFAEDTADALQPSQVPNATETSVPAEAPTETVAATEATETPISTLPTEPVVTDPEETEASEPAAEVPAVQPTPAEYAAQVGEEKYATLQEAIDHAPDGAVVTMLGDINGVTADSIITFPAGKSLVLDMNGKFITVSPDFTGRPVVNEGVLTVTGDGTIDSSASTANGYGAINNKGTLTIENGTFLGSKASSGSAIRNTGADAVLTVNGGTFYGSPGCIFNEGTAVLNAGMFKSESCSSCYADWSYVVQNRESAHLTVNGGSYEGTHGGIGVAGGEAVINGGTFRTVDCPKGHGAIFYALYVAGADTKAHCIVNGGTFSTEGRNATVLVGNDTPGDGGLVLGASCEILGGDYSAPRGTPVILGAKKSGNPIVTGGTFSDDSVQKYIPDGWEQTSSGEISKAAVQNQNHVAELSGQFFTSLDGAIKAAADGDTVKLLKSIADCGKITVDKVITLDLNSNNIGFAQKAGFYVNSGNLTLTGEGTVYEQEPYFAPVVMLGSDDPAAENYSVLTVNSDVTLKGWSGVFVDGNNGSCWGVVVNIHGTLIGVKDIGGDSGTGLYVNGTITNAGNYPRITLDGAKITQDGNDSIGLYLAGYSETVIRNSTIDCALPGSNGVEIRAGELTISNSIINGGSGEFGYDPNGNGSTAYNGAVVISQHTTKLPVNVTVESGSFSGSVSFAQVNPQKNDADAVNKIEIAINGGDFNGKVFSENKTGFISGGTFSEDLDNTYIAPGNEDALGEDGKFQIKPSADAVAQINGKGYTSLQAAVDAVTDDTAATITLLRDVNDGTGVVVPSGRNITFDLAGHTYRVDGGLVGSPGTESNGFQLLKDSDITFKNGTLTTGPALILIQNYSNLTLENVRVDVSGSACMYAVSNNNGNTQFTGNTSIIAAEGQVAFDVCRFSSYEGAKVTVNTTGTISGKVELSDSNGTGSAPVLNIQNGTFQGDLNVLYPYAQVAISGGNFSKPVDEKYIVEGCGLHKNPDGTYGVHHHDAQLTGQKDASCTEPGYTGDQVCKICNEVLVQGEEIPAVGHKLVKHDAKEPTVDAEGNIAYFECPVCGKLFRDAEGKEDILLADTVLPKLPKPTDPTEPSKPIEPSKPTEPSKPSDPTKPTVPAKPSTPSTGDNTDTLLMTGAFVAAMIGLVMLITIPMKKPYRGKHTK